MRLTVAILSLILAAAQAPAADDPRRAQVSAATADALSALEADVLSAPVTADVTVEQFVEKTDSRAELVKALRRAEQIGGTRWLDDQTCQVRMELPGTELADALVEIAAARPRAAGVPAEVLRDRVAPLREMTFAATGMSTSAIDRLRPNPDQRAWRGVADDVIRVAVGEARRSAARQVVESVEAVDLPGGGGGGRLGDVFEKDRKVRDALEGWAMNRPVTSVDFGEDDLEVRVTIAVRGEDFWNELAAAVGDRQDLGFPPDEAARRELRERVLARVEPTVGRARAQGDVVVGPAQPPAGGRAGAGGAGAVVDLPRDPPRWASAHLDATGTAPPVDGRLRTARAAEAAAREDLRRQIADLSLSRKQTLGAAARDDGWVRDAIDRTVRRVKVRKVNYLADRSAEVSISLDLRELWYELESRP